MEGGGGGAWPREGLAMAASKAVHAGVQLLHGAPGTADMRSSVRPVKCRYADALTVELLPLYLTNALGESSLQFGDHLKNCGGLVEVGASLGALPGACCSHAPVTIEAGRLR